MAFRLPAVFCFCLLVAAPAFAQSGRFSGIKRNERDRQSKLEMEPGVVYFNDPAKRPVELTIIKEAPVFSDKEGNHRVGFIRADQTVKLEAMTERAYYVRGKGTRDDLVGWVPPWAFSSKDPNFVENLKKLYSRQIVVQRLVANHQVAVGMTVSEVAASLGKPTRTDVRKTGKGESGRWEYIDYEDQKNYALVRDPYTGNLFRQLVSVTRIEKGKTSVEFDNGFVSAIEESENNRRGAGDVRLIVPPVVFGW
ncbi:hypothetical protein KBB96_14790 [Luteolibacter ambystomatis]|uniref:Uncharacterized protein n=1 Tax=Luteolibacter ambystomatis TaxID=2824561 RepID=A0A975IZS8_9BACT|nr:hypothetical protein [Luteolibacter ambystomatis]QUE50130.1 hypothetical protein KBB96_14790 [Luteolibacter ambystomatis]